MGAVGSMWLFYFIFHPGSCGCSAGTDFSSVCEPCLRSPCLLCAEILNSYRLQVLFHCCPFNTVAVSHSILVQECP